MSATRAGDMEKPRILFIPAYSGLPSHFIPLLKLYQLLDTNRYDAAFLLPKLSREEVRSSQLVKFNPHAEYYYGGEFLSHFDVPRVSAGQRFSVLAEIKVYKQFRPDLIIDDCSVTTALALQIHPIPRATLVRAGVFDRGTGWPAGYRHSFQPLIDLLTEVPGAPFRLADTFSGYFRAGAHLVPGVQSLENIPDIEATGVRNFYCGPLILDEREEQLFQSQALQEFFRVNGGKRIAYVTFGVVSAKSAHERVVECCLDLVRRDFAIVTNIRLHERLGVSAADAAQRGYYFATTLPMHYLCSKVDLVVHVGSTGAYHYPILHEKPAITVGTQCYDREEIARNLQMRGLSKHLPAAQEAEDFRELFSAAIDDFLGSRPPFDDGLRQRLQCYRREMRQSQERFNLGEVIQWTLAHGNLRP